MSVTLTDIKTGEVYTVETEQRPASELFQWLRGTQWDMDLTVGRMVKQNKSPRG